MGRRRLTPDARILVETLEADGAGRGRAEGFDLRVLGALPGETATVRVTRRRRRRQLDAVARTVDRPHTERVMPDCPWTGRCGGCVLQHLDVDGQRSRKRARLAELLGEAGAAAPRRWLPDVVGPGAGYRHKARLGVRHVPALGGALVGFRERGGGRVADVAACRILAPAIGERLGALRELIDRLTVAAAVPQLEVAVGDDAAAVIVRHLEPLTEADLVVLREWSRREGIHLYLQPSGPTSVHRLWPETGTERLHYALPDERLRFAFHPLDFTQVNPFVNRQMVPLAAALLAPTAEDRVLDLFCGLGNFTLPLARRAREVIGVEGATELVERGRENARANGIDNVRFETADLYAPDLDPASLPSAELLLLDPPRSGAEALCRGIAGLAPRRIVYVSCHPASLARDAALLTARGYRLEAAGILDMFPHTAHVESIALFCSEGA